MPEADEGFPWWLWLVGMFVVLILLGSCPQDSADTELARAAREAVEMARESRADDRSAVLWIGRFRLVALIIGVSMPILIAFLIFRHSSKSEIDAVEIIEAAERYASLDRTLPPTPNLPPASAPPVAGSNPDDASAPVTPTD